MKKNFKRVKYLQNSKINKKIHFLNLINLKLWLFSGDTNLFKTLTIYDLIKQTKRKW